jgi:hypothetical protein
MKENYTCSTACCFIYVVYVSNTELRTTQLLSSINWFTFAAAQPYAVGWIRLVITTHVFAFGVNVSTAANLIGIMIGFFTTTKKISGTTKRI